jgi:predicted transcriptional regulator
MNERIGILPDWVQRPETRWAAGALLLVLTVLSWVDVLGTGLAIRRVQDEVTRRGQRLAVLRQEQAENRPSPATARPNTVVPREASLSRILAGLASAAGGATASLLDVDAASTVTGTLPVTTRIRLSGDPGRVAAILRELEQGPAHLLVSAVTVQLPAANFGSTTWIVSGVLP